MKKKKPLRVSVRDIAYAAGVSKSAVGYALQNSPNASKETRERVLRVAKRLGYVPDARIASWMASVRDAKSKELLPIAWLNTSQVRDDWHKWKFLTPCIEGARERALQLGYRLEEIWLHEPGLTVARIAQMLYRRNTEGVIVTHPVKHLRLDWEHLAGVCLGGGLLAPRLHAVMTDHYQNVLLACKMLKRNGYRRIGLCLTRDFERGSSGAATAAAHYFHAANPSLKKVTPLIYDGDNFESSMTRYILKWIGLHEPDVIVCHDNRLVAGLEQAGYRVPEEIGVVHLATDDDVADWAGITSHRRETGAFAAELVVSLMHTRQFGVPKIARNTIMRGTWHEGRTLLTPKQH